MIFFSPYNKIHKTILYLEIKVGVFDLQNNSFGYELFTYNKVLKWKFETQSSNFLKVAQ